MRMMMRGLELKVGWLRQWAMLCRQRVAFKTG